jgi:hypothetical protein
LRTLSAPLCITILLKILIAIHLLSKDWSFLAHKFVTTHINVMNDSDLRTSDALAEESMSVSNKDFLFGISKCREGVYK